MSKKSKKERKAEREAQRAALRRQERQRNLFTLIVIGIVVAIGGVLVWVSLERDDELDDLLADLETEQDDPAATADPEPPEPMPQPPADPEEDERPIACGADLPEHAGETKPVYSEPQQVVEEGVAYQAVVETSCGRVVVDLDSESTPEGVNAFVFLATTGFYDGLEIFRHAPSIEVFQTGSGSNQAAFSIGYYLPDELAAVESGGYPPGSVAYANAGPGTSGSQFFFVYGEGFQDAVDQGGLQPIYTRFGMVSEGLDVLQDMADIPLDGETPQERVYMETVRILADGEELPTRHVTVEEPTEEPLASPEPTGATPTASPEPTATEQATDDEE